MATATTRDLSEDVKHHAAEDADDPSPQLAALDLLDSVFAFGAHCGLRRTFVLFMEALLA